MGSVKRRKETPPILDEDELSWLEAEDQRRNEQILRDNQRFGACEDDAEVKIMWRGLL